MGMMPKVKPIENGNESVLEVVAPRTKRRSFSPAEKLRIVREAEECRASGRTGAIGALLRREGINSSHLTFWTRALQAHGVEGISLAKRGRKPKHDQKDRRIMDLEKKLNETERELEIAQGLVELQKKVSLLLGVALPPSKKS